MRIAPLLIGAISTISFAQDISLIATDRPGFSDGSNVVPKGKLQMESGFFRTQVGSSVTTSLGDGLFRYGLSQKYELRLIGISYGFAPGVRQWLDPSIGFKSRIIQTDKREVTLIGQTTVPIGQGPLRSNEWNPTIKVAASTALGADTLGGNLVFARLGSGDDQFVQSALSLNLTRSITSSTSLTGEVWAVDKISRNGPMAGYFSLAVVHLLDRSHQLDLRLGSGLNQSRDGWFLQGGYSVRF